MTEGWVRLWRSAGQALVTAVGGMFASRGVGSSRLAGGVVLCFALCVCGTAATTVAAAQGDAGATAVYLRAADAFARVQAANVKPSVAVMEEEAARIASGCPAVLVGAPKGGQFSLLGAEIVSAVLFSSAAPDRTAMLAFVGKIDALHWNNQTVAKLVRAVAAEERATAKLVLPDVCSDLNEWTSSGYRTLSPSTVDFLKTIEAIGKETKGANGNEEPEEALLRRLRPYETPTDRRLALQVTRLDETVAKRLLSAYAAAVSRVGQALGLKASELSGR